MEICTKFILTYIYTVHYEFYTPALELDFSFPHLLPHLTFCLLHNIMYVGSYDYK